MAFADYAEIGNGLYVNLAETSMIYCANNASVIVWLSGQPESLQDGCAFASKVESFSRRS